MARWRMLLTLLVLLLVLGQPVLRRGNLGCRVTFGRDAVLGAGCQLHGHMVVFGGDAIVAPEATVHGDVLALGGSIEVGGRVDGQAFAPSGRISLDPTATVLGDAVASGAVALQPGATVHGQVMSAQAGASAPLLSHWRHYCLLGLPGLWFGWPWGVGLAGNLFVWGLQVLLGSLVLVALGTLVLLIAPGPVQTASHALCRHPWQSVGAGVLAWLVTVVGTPLLASTIVGIPVAAAIVALVAAGLLVAWVPAGLAIGQHALRGRARREPLLAAAVGLAALAALTSLPGVGLAVIGAIALWGLGAVLMTRFGTAPHHEWPFG